MEFDLEAEKQEILRRYRGLLRAAKNSKKRSERKAIRKAFDVALDAHKDIRRKSGEPYIYHPIAVARVVAEERLDMPASLDPPPLSSERAPTSDSGTAGAAGIPPAPACPHAGAPAAGWPPIDSCAICPSAW